jgi:hypothetical protein
MKTSEKSSSHLSRCTFIITIIVNSRQYYYNGYTFRKYKLTLMLSYNNYLWERTWKTLVDMLFLIYRNRQSVDVYGNIFKNDNIITKSIFIPVL